MLFGRINVKMVFWVYYFKIDQNGPRKTEAKQMKENDSGATLYTLSIGKAQDGCNREDSDTETIKLHA